MAPSTESKALQGRSPTATISLTNTISVTKIRKERSRLATAAVSNWRAAPSMMRANGIDPYFDLVENQRDRDDGRFNFRYVNAFQPPGEGRFARSPGDFHPHVPQDPGVFSDVFQFGRDLAPMNGQPAHHCFDGLLGAVDWLMRALDLNGFRLDNVKGVSTEFIVPLLNHGGLTGEFAVCHFE
jgi:alpha-amylase